MSENNRREIGGEVKGYQGDPASDNKCPAAGTGSRVEAAFASNASVQPKTLLLDGKPVERRENLQVSLFVLWGNGPVT